MMLIVVIIMVVAVTVSWIVTVWMMIVIMMMPGIVGVLMMLLALRMGVIVTVRVVSGIMIEIMGVIMAVALDDFHMIVTVTVAMVMGVEVKGLPTLKPTPQHPQPHGQYEKAGHQAQITVQGLFGQSDLVRSNFGCNGQKDHAEGVREGDHEAQKNGVPPPALGTDEISRHHGFAVPWLQGMKTAKGSRCQVVDQIKSHSVSSFKTDSSKVHLLRCTSPRKGSTYKKYSLPSTARAPCIWPFLRIRQTYFEKGTDLPHSRSTGSSLDFLRSRVSKVSSTRSICSPWGLWGR